VQDGFDIADDEEGLGFTTRAVSAWKNVGEVRQRPASPPIYQAATFVFDDIDDFADVGMRKIDGGYLYSRWANPTTDALARTLALLEGTEAAACFASGMAAIAGALRPLVRHGDHIVSSAQLYGGTHALFTGGMARAGVDVTMVDVGDLAAIDAAFTDRTRALYCETIGNPSLDIADIDGLSAIARAHGVPLVADATFTPPCILRPVEHGVDLVVHSATKYLGGHSDVIGGVVAGSASAIADIRLHAIDAGACLAPFDAWLLARGVQTLALRMERICASALTLARFLEDHEAVSRVVYPGLETHPQHARARALLDGCFGGMLTLEVAGGLAAGRRFLERVRVAAPAASLGGTKTLVVHPASVTHTQLDERQLLAAGITAGMLRVSVGIEDVEDLVADFERALR